MKYQAVLVPVTTLSTSPLVTTVPEGEIWHVKQIHWCNSEGTDDNLDVGINGIGAAYSLIYHQPVPYPSYDDQYGLFVLQSGDTIQAQCTGDSIDITVLGDILTNG